MARIVPCGEKRSINARSTGPRRTSAASIMRDGTTPAHGGARNGTKLGAGVR
ncbi:hypothetical protein [Streptomyces sp. NPDC051014]|uniref:hypothetical protein n=1 Tax=Streptomyces TaxID=1883 RepID=UPI00340C02F2